MLRDQETKYTNILNEKDIKIEELKFLNENLNNRINQAELDLLDKENIIKSLNIRIDHFTPQLLELDNLKNELIKNINDKDILCEKQLELEEKIQMLEKNKMEMVS
jgi:hypothetical protein